jgi:periplasmic protein TonB
MKPEQILQTSFLDILFNNRNKEYGAYALRKGYNMRLAKAISTMLFIALAVCILVKMKIDNKPVETLLPLIYTEEVFLQNVNEKMIEPVEQERRISSPVQKTITQIDNASITIVEDSKADKRIHTVDEMEGKEIGLITVDGDPFSGIPATPAEIRGKVNVVVPAEVKTPEILAPVFKAQVMPEFPGGKDGLLRYMLRNLKEPDFLPEGQKFVIVVRFVVDVDGSVKNAEIIKSGGEFDNDVLKVINKMPRWKPGKQDGRLIPVYFQMPVTFEGRDY